jgi:hypothetical protein
MIPDEIIVNNCSAMYFILSRSEETMKYAPDSLMRLFVSLAVDCDWDEERVKKEALTGIEYWFKNETAIRREKSMDGDKE